MARRLPRSSFVLGSCMLALALAGCASAPTPRMHRAGSTGLLVGTRASAPTAAGAMATRDTDQDAPDRHPASAAPPTAMPPPRPRFRGEPAAFNFSDETVQTVAKAVLGEMLHQRYTIAPGVQGSITLVNPQPIPPEEAVRLLERALIANGLRLLYSDGGFLILPADQALASGLVAPSAAGGTGIGYGSRIVPLRWIGAGEMETLLRPYARPAAIVDVDPVRNQITLAGSQEELHHYLQIVDTFDVDWMGRMSVASIPVGSGRPSALATELDRVFGAQSGLPVAGLARFIPLDGAGTLVAIAPQPGILDQVLAWVDRFEASGGDAPRVHAYDLKYLRAKELASRLSELVEHAALIDGGTVGPWGGIGISPVEETNSVLVRATPRAWRSLRDAISRIDVMPLQVHLEAQIAEVRMEGALRHGVSTFFDHAVTAPVDEGGAGLPEAARSAWRSIQGSIQPADQGLGWVFRGRNAAAVVRLLDTMSDVRILQSPSLLVKNNTEALLNAGSRIPVVSVRLDTAAGAGAYSQIQYLDTGLLLRVKPRVTREGHVFLELEQEVSTPGAADSADANGNVRIDTSRLKTAVTLRAGDTMMLAGVMRQGTERGSSGSPGASRIPVLGGLLGQQRTSQARDELVMLVTASIASDTAGLRALTDDYLRRFRAVKPLSSP